MRFASLLAFTFRFAMSSTSGESRCILQSDNSTYCENLELKLDEPAKVSQSTDVVYISFAKGSISAKTLAPFQNAKMLDLYMCDITHVEDGALGSLPNLKELHITHSNFPTLTRGILKGCDKVKKFRTYCSLKEDALWEMPDVEDLELSGPLTTSFTKAYLEPMKQLKILLLEIGDLKEELEAGVFCNSPLLEDVKLYLRSPIRLKDSLFVGCNSVKKLYITGRDVVIDGTSFSKMPHLEELTLHQVQLKHITKEFLTGFPNLKTFEFVEGEIKIDGDAFVNVPNLTKLELNIAELQDTDLEALRPLSNLVFLRLSYNNINNMDLMPALPRLEVLDLKGNSISNFNFIKLKQKMPNMKEIDLKANPLNKSLEEELKKEEVIKVIVGPEDIVDPFWGQSRETSTDPSSDQW